MPRKTQPKDRKPRVRWKSPPPKSIISIGDYGDVTSLNLDPSVVSTVEFFTKLLFEPADEPEYEIKSLLEHALSVDNPEQCTSIGQLHSMAVQCIKALDILAAKRPDLLRPLASKKTMWPTLYSHSSLHKPELDERLQRIGFATEAGMTWIRVNDVSKNLSQPPFESPKGLAILLINSIHSFRTAYSSSTRITDMFKQFYTDPCDEDTGFQAFRWNVIQCAIAVIAYNHVNIFPKYTSALVDDCVLLPDFSSEKLVTNAWWDVGYQLLMLNFMGRPEIAAPLYEMGRSREKHYSGLKVTSTEEYYKPEAVKSNVRSKILTDLKEEFERLAKQLAKTEKKGVTEKNKNS